MFSLSYILGFSNVHLRHYPCEGYEILKFEWFMAKTSHFASQTALKTFARFKMYGKECWVEYRVLGSRFADRGCAKNENRAVCR